MPILTPATVLCSTPNQCFADNNKLSLNEAQYRALIHRLEDEKGLRDKLAVMAEDIPIKSSGSGTATLRVLPPLSPVREKVTPLSLLARQLALPRRINPGDYPPHRGRGEQ